MSFWGGLPVNDRVLYTRYSFQALTVTASRSSCFGNFRPKMKQTQIAIKSMRQRDGSITKKLIAIKTEYVDSIARRCTLTPYSESLRGEIEALKRRVNILETRLALLEPEGDAENKIQLEELEGTVFFLKKFCRMRFNSEFVGRQTTVYLA